MTIPTTDWFLCAVDDAAELAAAPPDELVDRWRSVSLPHVLETEMLALAKLLLGPAAVYDPIIVYPESADAEDDVTHEAFEGGTYVTLVPEAFVAALARLDDASLEKFAPAWRANADELRSLRASEVTSILATMRDFAAIARASRIDVLSVFEV